MRAVTKGKLGSESQRVPDMNSKCSRKRASVQANQEGQHHEVPGWHKHVSWRHACKTWKLDRGTARSPLVLYFLNLCCIICTIWNPQNIFKLGSISNVCSNIGPKTWYRVWPAMNRLRSCVLTPVSSDLALNMFCSAVLKGPCFLCDYRSKHTKKESFWATVLVKTYLQCDVNTPNPPLRPVGSFETRAEGSRYL